MNDITKNPLYGWYMPPTTFSYGIGGGFGSSLANTNFKYDISSSTWTRAHLFGGKVAAGFEGNLVDKDGKYSTSMDPAFEFTQDITGPYGTLGGYSVTANDAEIRLGVGRDGLAQGYVWGKTNIFHQLPALFENLIGIYIRGALSTE